MAYGIVHHYPGGTKQQYEATLEVVHPSKGKLPTGQIYHAAGASADGWNIVAIFNSKGEWEKFRDALMPKLKAGIKGGFTTPPKETAFEVHNLLKA
jgi:hypothetical protein